MMESIGYWNALAWGSLFGVLLLIAYLALGKRGTGRETEEFLCGESFEYRTPAHNFFFGFEKSLERFFRAGERFHSDIINEYVAWMLVFALVSLLAFVLMFILGVGVI